MAQKATTANGSDEKLGLFKEFLYELREEETSQGIHLQPRFNFLKFGLVFFGQLIPILLLVLVYIYFCYPSATFAANLSFGWQFWLSFLVSYLAVGSFGEWALHLNVLHKETPGLEESFKSHHVIHHKKHTQIKGSQTKITSKYAIESKEQTEKATFPWYIISAFCGIFFVLGHLIQPVVPSFPIIIPLLLGMSTAVYLYENKHAADHFPESWWRKQCHHVWPIGKIFLWVHSQHHLHHWRPRRNLNVVGFLLLPIADWFFGTYIYSKKFAEIWLKDNLEPGEEVMNDILAELESDPWIYKSAT